MTKIKDLPDYEKPRERLIKYGVENLSNEDLIAIILRTGTKNLSAKDLSLEILKNAKNLNNLKSYTYHSFLKIKGLGMVKAITLCAAIEFGKRVYKDNYEKDIIINSTTKVFKMFKYYFKNVYQEEFIVLYLDAKKKLIEKKVLFKGTLDQSIAHPREIFKYAYIFSAQSLICIHNHPSGSILPSKQDDIFTLKIIKIGKLLQIEVLDHIIIGNNKYYSYLENNKVR